MHPTLSNAVKAARRAGGIIMRASQDVGALKIHTKNYNDFVTEAWTKDPLKRVFDRIRAFPRNTEKACTP